MGLKLVLCLSYLLYHNVSSANPALSIHAVGDRMLGLHENQEWPRQYHLW